MSRMNATPLNCVYGAGAPTGTAQPGTRYIDDTTESEYEYSGGAWNLLVNGGGGGGLPYTDNGGYWYVYAPMGLFVHSVDYPLTELIVHYNVLVKAQGGVYLISGAAYTSLTPAGDIVNGPAAGKDFIIKNLPVLGGGPVGSLWNNLGVLNIN